MPLILNIETSGKICSVNLSRDGKAIALREHSGVYSHAEKINVYIQEICAESGTELKSIDAAAISSGPGSYTGLRIGASTAKGICYALEKPLIAVPTLHSMTNGFIGKNSDRISEDGISLLCPMIDARRMEVYAAIFDLKMQKLRAENADIVDAETYGKWLSENKIIFFGDGSAKCEFLYAENANAVFENSFESSSSDMISLSEEKFGNHEFEDLAYFEPFYLKDFMATTPRKKV